jgi:hypothetical protein
MAHLFGKKERIYDERKQNFKITLEKLLANYARMFVVELDNVTSNQMHQVYFTTTSTHLPCCISSDVHAGPHDHARQG